MKINKNGFTLIEVLVATFIAGVVITAIIVLFINAIFVNTEVKNKEIATKLAHQKIEELRADWEMVAMLPATSPPIDVTSSGLKDGKMIILASNSTSDPASREIRVKVEWTSRKGNTKNIEIPTRITEGGI